jgi:signal transduction histidine kinase/ActR/RegA family two-component response regulator
MVRLTPNLSGDRSPWPANDPFLLRTSLNEAIQTAQTAVRDITRLIRLLTILNEPAPLALLLDRVLSTLSELFLSDIVVLLDPVGSGTFIPLAAIGLPEDTIHLPLSDDEVGYVRQVIETKRSILIEQAGEDPKVEAHLRDLGCETIVWLPVMSGQTTRGVLILARCRPIPFSHTEVGLLSAMTYRIGLTLEQAHRSKQLEQIILNGRQIGRHLDKSALYTLAVEMFPGLIGADAAVLFMEGHQDKTDCVALFGVDPNGISHLHPISNRLLNPANQIMDEPVSSPDPFGSTNQLLENLPKSSSVGSLLATPIHLNNQSKGVLFAIRSTNACFSPDARQMAKVFAGQISAALENARLYQALQEELTERVCAEREREMLKARLDQAQKMEAIGTFAGGIAHDFNNLLGAIMGNIDLARLDMDRSTESFILLQNALQATKQAADLTRRFITFSSGGHPSKVVANPKNLITDAVTLSLSGSSVRAEFFLSDNLWEIEADPEQMRQALSNIVLNAREFTPSGGVVTVTATNIERVPLSQAARETDPKEKFIEITITDQGKGIPAEDLPKIFDPYFSTKDRGSYKGMGLGLSIALSIVNKHQGYIRVESPPDRGTSFHILLPANPSTRDEKLLPVVDPLLEYNLPRRILLMEDEEALAKITLNVLCHLGHREVSHVREGMEAISQFSNAKKSGEPFDLVILDLTVKGGMGGLETVGRLKEIDPTVKAVVSSGYSNDPVLADHIKYGFCAALRKPYGIKELQALMEMAFRV